MDINTVILIAHTVERFLRNRSQLSGLPNRPKGGADLELHVYLNCYYPNANKTTVIGLYLSEVYTCMWVSFVHLH